MYVLLKIKQRALIKFPVKIIVLNLKNQSRICFSVQVLKMYLLIIAVSIIFITSLYFITESNGLLICGLISIIIFLIYTSEKIHTHLRILDNKVHNDYKKFVSN